MNQKNRGQKAELAAYLDKRYQELTQKLEKLYQQQAKEGFSPALFTQINLTEYSLMVCEKRMKGNIANPRFDMELAVPKVAS